MFVTEIIKKLDLEKINSLINDGYLIRNAHPNGELFIYNYTAKAQFDNLWTNETLQCRGLIADKEGNIVARPFPKFFNIKEHKYNLPLEPFEVFEKIDGSLGILYFYEGEPYIASRGSFTSEQAKEANKILQVYFSLGYKRCINPDYTYLFEIVYPENRIVVDYGNTRALYFIAAINTRTGEEIFDTSLIRYLGIPYAEKFHYEDITSISEMNIDNKEGFVIRFQSGVRVKVKFKDYIKLHGFITQVTKKKIWELIKNNLGFDDFIKNVPDELYKWIKEVESDLRRKYHEIEENSKIEKENISSLPRKEIALKIKDHPYKSVIFRMLDNKDYSNAIWDMIEPENDVPVIEGLQFYQK